MTFAPKTCRCTIFVLYLFSRSGSRFFRLFLPLFGLSEHALSGNPIYGLSCWCVLVFCFSRLVFLRKGGSEGVTSCSAKNNFVFSFPLIPCTERSGVSNMPPLLPLPPTTPLLMGGTTPGTPICVCPGQVLIQTYEIKKERSSSDEKAPPSDQEWPLPAPPLTSENKKRSSKNFGRCVGTTQ